MDTLLWYCILYLFFFCPEWFLYSLLQGKNISLFCISQRRIFFVALCFDRNVRINDVPYILAHQQNETKRCFTTINTPNNTAFTINWMNWKGACFLCETNPQRSFHCSFDSTEDKKNERRSSISHWMFRFAKAMHRFLH